MLEQLSYLVDQSKRKNVVVQVNSSIDSAEREALAEHYRMADLNDRGPAAALWSMASPVADVVAGLLSQPKHGERGGHPLPATARGSGCCFD